MHCYTASRSNVAEAIWICFSIQKTMYICHCDRQNTPQKWRLHIRLNRYVEIFQKVKEKQWKSKWELGNLPTNFLKTFAKLSYVTIILWFLILLFLPKAESVNRCWSVQKKACSRYSKKTCKITIYLRNLVICQWKFSKHSSDFRINMDRSSNSFVFDKTLFVQSLQQLSNNDKAKECTKFGSWQILE